MDWKTCSHRYDDRIGTDQGPANAEMIAEALNCPNCGAAVASDHAQCDFCKTRLKTMACPSCFGLMFVGSQFCGHCGAKAVQTAVQDGDDLGECPRCRKRLDLLKVADVA